MNITCGQCGKRYKMKAEQTKKAFKTRCKRCSNVIIVRPEDHQAKTGESGSTRAQQPSQEQAKWYAVVNGQQSGPFTTSQVGEYLSVGSLDGQSFVWCEGMGNWEALEGVAELSAMIQKSVTPAPVTSAPTPETRASAEQQPAVEATPQEPQPSPALSMGVQIGHRRELLAEVASQTAEIAQSEPAQAEVSGVMFDSATSSSNQFTNQRNENSVLFSLDSIDNMGSQGVDVKNSDSRGGDLPGLGSPLVTNTGGSEGSGLIDLAALSSLTSSGRSADGGQPAPINITAGVKKMGGGYSLTNRSSDIKTIALAVCSTALVVILGFVGYQKFMTPPQPSAPISLGNSKVARPTMGTTNSALKAVKPSSVLKVDEPKTVTKAKSERLAATKPKPDPKPKVRANRKRSSAARPSQSSRSNRPKPSASATKRKSRSSSRKKRRSSKPKKSEASALLSNLKGGRRSSRGSSDLSAITGSSKPKKTGPKKPSKKSIVKAMRRVNINGCLGREPALKGKGKIKVRIVAVSSGAIKTARVLNSPFKNSPVGACLEREVRRQRFPSFTDSSISFTFPFKN